MCNVVSVKQDKCENSMQYLLCIVFYIISIIQYIALFFSILLTMTLTVLCTRIVICLDC